MKTESKTEPGVSVVSVGCVIGICYSEEIEIGGCVERKNGCGSCLFS